MLNLYLACRLLCCRPSSVHLCPSSFTCLKLLGIYFERNSTCSQSGFIFLNFSFVSLVQGHDVTDSLYDWWLQGHDVTNSLYDSWLEGHDVTDSLYDSWLEGHDVTDSLDDLDALDIYFLHNLCSNFGFICSIIYSENLVSFCLISLCQCSAFWRLLQYSVNIEFTNFIVFSCVVCPSRELFVEV